MEGLSTRTDQEVAASMVPPKSNAAQAEALPSVNHPQHYGGEYNPYEAIKVIDAWRLSFCLGNTVKYISRAGKKDPATLIEDLLKARWYLDHEIERLKKL